MPKPHIKKRGIRRGPIIQKAGLLKRQLMPSSDEKRGFSLTSRGFN